jgi:hypothetical protein
MKTYTTPQLTNAGRIVESTKQFIPGTRDPKDVAHILLMAPGSVGFQL